MQDTCYQAAIHYAKHYGFACFPTYGIKETAKDGKSYKLCACGLLQCGAPGVHPGGKLAGKHPAVSKGLNAASKEERVIENLWAGRSDLNVAIRTGPESGIFVIDIDGENGAKNLANLESIHGKLPKTLTSITSRGKHYVFKYPDKKVFSRNNAIGEGIDVRGSGGYFIAPPSRHISGHVYTWEEEGCPVVDAPQWALDLACSTLKAEVVNESALINAPNPLNKWNPEDVESMLGFLDPDMDHDSWVRVGMAVQQGGFNFSLWDKWSALSNSKYDKQTCVTKWKSFKPNAGITMGTLVDMAMLNGWKPDSYISEPVNWDTHPARQWLTNIGVIKKKQGENAPPPTKEEIKEEKLAPWVPFDPLELPPGLIGNTVRWICGTATQPQPVLTMLNVMACLGAVFGRRYATETGIRSNVFIVGLADTGTGKDHSRGELAKLMDAAGLDMYKAAHNIKSAPGLIVSLQRQPSCIMMIDEFGRVMQGIVGEKAAAHKADIGTAMLELYGASGKEYKSGNYADSTVRPQAVKDPNLSIYGTTTLESYVASMKKISIQDGMTNRFIISPGDNRPVLNHEPCERSIPDDLLLAWQEFVPPADKMASLINPEVMPRPTIVVLTELVRDKIKYKVTAREYFKELLIKQDHRRHTGGGDTKTLWARFRENVMKIAMQFAICRNMHDPKIEMEDLIYAEKIVQCAVEFVIELAQNYMYENEIEKNKKEVLKIIRRSGKKGMSRTDLLRLNGGIRRKELDDIITVLLEEENVRAELERTATKPKVTYVAN